MRVRLITLSLALLWAAGAPAASSADEARVWIKRMNDALVNRSYDGVLTHKWQGGSQGLRLIHGKRDGRMVERVVSLNGSGYEFIRNGSQYVEYYPAIRTAVVQTRNRSFGYIAALNGVSAESDKHYVISSGGVQPLLGWPAATQVISVEPRDTLRYGYRFWLDPQNAMPVKTQLVTKAGEVIDEISFSSLRLVDNIPDELLKPAVNPKDYHWKKRLDVQTEAVKLAFVPRADRLPLGYQVVDFKSPAPQGQSSAPQARFIVSDGISWVSVIVTVAENPPLEKFAEGFGPPMGAQASYVLRRDDHYISVMGEVPPMVARSIAHAVLPE
jgi:sigma-E factor negative regulatory protein RseB